MTVSAFRFRTAFILVLLTAWAVCAGVKLYIHSVRDRDLLLKKARLLAWREADLPAPRGKIMDRDGFILAQDVFRCDLVLESLPEQKMRRQRLLSHIGKYVPDFHPDDPPRNCPAVLKANLPADEIELCIRRFRSYPEVRTVGRFEREFTGGPDVRELVGQIALNDRRERVGISGLEQRHDLALSGKTGRLMVMLDRNGGWVYDTLRVTRQPESGRDLKLDQSIAEIRKKRTRDEYDGP